MRMVDTEQAPRRGKSLARTSSLSAILLIVGKALNLATLLGLSVVMTLAAYGEFMYVRGILLFLGPFMSLGLSVTAMRRIPGYLEQSDPARASGYLSIIFKTTLIAASIVAVLTALGGYVFAGAARAETLAIALIGLPGFALLVAQTQAARAFGHVLISYGPMNLLQPLTLAIGALLIWLISELPRQNTMAALLAFSMLIAAAIQWFFLRRDNTISATSPLTEPKPWITESAPFTVSMAAQGIAASGPLLILGVFAQSTTLGVFGFFQALMQGLTIFNTAIFGAANPQLSAHISGERHGQALRLLRRSRALAFGITMFGAVAGVLGVTLLAPYVKPEFGAAPWVLLALLLSIAINSTSGPLGHVLIIHDRRFWEVSAQILAACVTLILCFALIPSWGMMGAAIATLAAALCRSIVLHVLVFGRLKYGSPQISQKDSHA